MYTTRHCTARTVTHCTWTCTVLQVSGTFWLSRLTRDRDTVLRALAVDILARLMQPGAPVAHAMVLQVRV